jgi:putative transposase
MTDWQDRALQIAAFRYRLIAEAAEADGQGVTIAIERAAGREYHDPDGHRAHYTPRTLWRWLQAYRLLGLLGLMPRRRADALKPKAISEKVLGKAIQLRKQNPRRATATLIDMLERTKVVEPGSLKRSTLDRHLEAAGVSRRMLQTVGDKVFGTICTSCPLQLVIADFHHSPYVRTPGGDGQARRALLLCFIDHFSRYILEGRYYLHEDFAALRLDLALFGGHCSPLRQGVFNYV